MIDEIQKLPKLLDLVQQMIHLYKKEKHFILTGSSARKLKYGGANLLAGRAFVCNLYPLTCLELENNFELSDYLNWGGLPEVYSLDNESDKKSFLRAYGLTYMKEEVWAEQFIKKLDPFRDFLELCALSNGEIVNYKKMSTQLNVDHKTVQSYFQILEDTLLGFSLSSFNTSLRKRIVKSPKFYLFDPGVKRALDHTLDAPFVAKTYAYGRAFEHFIILQLWSLSQYSGRSEQFFYLKTEGGAEIDLIIQCHGRPTILVDIKSSVSVSISDVSHLKFFVGEIKQA